MEQIEILTIEEDNKMNFRIGFGYDVHKLEPGYKLILGNIDVPSETGAVGHSDADVLIHAICDALLGAAALGDIGKHFPDTDTAYKGIDSSILLQNVCRLLKEKKYSISNIDTTICLQKPKLTAYIPLMRKRLAEVMEIEEDQISVKATTTEKLGFVGEGKGISAYANALIFKI